MFRNDWVEKVTLELAKAMNLVRKGAFPNNLCSFRKIILLISDYA